MIKNCYETALLFAVEFFVYLFNLTFSAILFPTSYLALALFLDKISLSREWIRPNLQQTIDHYE